MSLQPISEIHGVKFFDNAPACISHFKKTHWLKKAISFIQSFGTLFLNALNKFISAVHNADAQINPLTLSGTEGFSKKRLIVCVHGLNSKPSQFKKIISEIQKKDLSETDIYVPHVLQKGNAKLDDMVKPIFEEIAKWAKTSEDKELILIGISNGGRISRAVEAEIAKSKCSANIKKLHFVSIVGACKGSTLVNLANKIGLSWVMSKYISEEMPTNSLRTRQLNQEWEDGLAHGPTREYTFIASPHDWQVTNYSSSLMAVNNQNVRYAIVPGHGHNSIVDAVGRTIAEIIT
jgi:triacylglycerol esterase/lipase EstA (alpha/beta hydrolase family)